MSDWKKQPEAHVRFLLIGGVPRSLVVFRSPLLRRIIASGWEAHAAAGELEKDVEISATLQRMGVKTHSVPLNRTGLSVLSDLRTFWALFRIMRQIRPNIVLAYTAKPIVWGLIAARLAGVPRRHAMVTGLGYAFTGQASGKRHLVQQILRQLYRIALAQSHGVIFQNPDDAALFQEYRLIPGHIPISIVNGSGVDLQHYQRAPLPEGPPRFLMIARLLGDKGVREYAEAARLIRRAYPACEFHLVGGLDPHPDGIKREELSAWRDEGVIVWHGEQKDVRPFIAKSHVYVLPSYREGLPRTILEAMAMGRAIITTDAPGCRETVVDGDNGFLVPLRDTGALAAAMEKLLLDPQLAARMGARSHEIAAQKFDVHKVNTAMLEAMGLA